MSRSKKDACGDEANRVIREFPRIDGRYRIRVLSTEGDPPKVVFDVREHLKTPRYSGYTKRGIRLSSLQGLRVLAEAIRQVLDGQMLPETAEPGSEPEA